MARTERAAPGAAEAAGPEKRRLYEAVFDTLAREILCRTLPEGAGLPPDAQLSERFGVSRTVVREALQHLATLRLVDVRHGAGTFVNPRSRWNLIDRDLLRLMEETRTIDLLADDLRGVRRMLEAEAARLAAHHATDAEIAAIGAVVERMFAEDLDLEEDLGLNRTFHRGIVEAAHNQVLLGLYDLLTGALHVTMNEYRGGKSAEAKSLANITHRLIWESLRDRDAETARAAMVTHLRGRGRVE